MIWTFERRPALHCLCAQNSCDELSPFFILLHKSAPLVFSKVFLRQISPSLDVYLLFVLPGNSTAARFLDQLDPIIRIAAGFAALCVVAAVYKVIIFIYQHFSGKKPRSRKKWTARCIFDEMAFYHDTKNP